MLHAVGRGERVFESRYSWPEDVTTTLGDVYQRAHHLGANLGELRSHVREGDAYLMLTLRGSDRRGDGGHGGLSLVLVTETKEASGATGDDGPRLDIPGHDGTGGDERTFPDRDAGKDDRPA